MNKNFNVSKCKERNGKNTNNLSFAAKTKEVVKNFLNRLNPFFYLHSCWRKFYPTPSPVLMIGMVIPRFEDGRIDRKEFHKKFSIGEDVKVLKSLPCEDRLEYFDQLIKEAESLNMSKYIIGEAMEKYRQIKVNC